MLVPESAEGAASSGSWFCSRSFDCTGIVAAGAAVAQSAKSCPCRCCQWLQACRVHFSDQGSMRTRTGAGAGKNLCAHGVACELTACAPRPTAASGMMACTTGGPARRLTRRSVEFTFSATRRRRFLATTRRGRRLRHRAPGWSSPPGRWSGRWGLPRTAAPPRGTSGLCHR